MFLYDCCVPKWRSKVDSQLAMCMVDVMFDDFSTRKQIETNLKLIGLSNKQSSFGFYE